MFRDSRSSLQQVSEVTEILSGAERALERLHDYHKFGRHSDVFLTELYFWFADCAHLMFSLRLAGEDGPWRALEEDPHWAPLIAELDFTPFYYLDYRRRTFYWNAYQEHLKDEPRWFRLWLRILGKSEDASVREIEDFSQRMLASVGHGDPSGRKVDRKNDATLRRFLRTGSGERMIASSRHVLEGMISALTSCVAKMDVGNCAPARIQTLAGILGRMRRIIIWDGVAQGYCPLRGNPGWGPPSMFALLHSWRAPGLLRVTPKDEGGEIVCTYTWNAGSKAKHRSWFRRAAATGQEYEDSLFDTWSYETGEYLRAAGAAAQTSACWVIEDAVAKHLEIVCRQADAILERLGTHPACGGFAEEVASVLRTRQGAGNPRKLAWTYIRDLDQLAGRLESVCREVQEPEGVVVKEENVAELWCAKQETVEVREHDVPGHDAAGQEAPDALISYLMGPGPKHGADTIQLRMQEEPKETADHAGIAGEVLPRDEQPAPPPAPAEPGPEAASRDLYRPAESPESADAADSDRRVVRPQGEKTAPAREHAADKMHPDGTGLLIRELVKHHQRPNGRTGPKPLSSKQLQQKLHWDPSRVQRAMTRVFGRKPFLLYKKKCADHTILAFLLSLETNESYRL